MIATTIFILLAGIAQTPPANDFVTACQQGFERTLGQAEDSVWLGSYSVVINDSGLKPVTTWCLDEGPNPPAKMSLAKVISDYVNQTPPPATHPATLVAWVEKGIVHVAVNTAVGEFEKSLLHLIEDSDGEDYYSDEWMAWGVNALGTFGNEWLKAKKDDEYFTIFYLGPANKEIELDVAIQPLLDLKILTLKSS